LPNGNSEAVKHPGGESCLPARLKHDGGLIAADGRRSTARPSGRRVRRGRGRGCRGSPRPTNIPCTRHPVSRRVCASAGPRKGARRRVTSVKVQRGPARRAPLPIADTASASVRISSAPRSPPSPAALRPSVPSCSTAGCPARAPGRRGDTSDGGPRGDEWNGI
jgi:hypothetical protein